MPVLNDSRRVRELCAGQQKDGLWMSIPEGSAALNPRDEIRGEGLGRKLRIAEQRRRESLGRKTS